MRRILNFVICLIFLFVSASACCAAEVITRFASDIQINVDSTMDVVETIEVNSEGNEIRHGIVRSFPVVYEENGRRRRVGFDVNSVQIDGTRAEYSLSNNGGYKDIRIGSPNNWLEPGRHVFTIAYQTSKQIGFYKDHDELYWNVTGDQWTFPIEKAVCRVKLPDRNFGQDINSAEWYIGKYGEKGNIADAKKNNDFKIWTVREMSPGEGITVVYTWKKGIIQQPTSSDSGKLKQVLISIITLLLTIGWYFAAWNMWGQDPQGRPIIPLFSAPHNESPAYLRFTRDINVDQTAFTAALLDLAVKGAIKIEAAGKDGVLSSKTYTLRFTHVVPNGLPVEEFELLQTLFPDATGTNEEKESSVCKVLHIKTPSQSGTYLGDSIRLDNSHAKHMQEVMMAFEAPLYDRKDELFSNHSFLCLPSILIFWVGVFGIFVADKADNMMTIIVSAALGLFIILYGTFVGYGGKRSHIIKSGASIGFILYVLQSASGLIIKRISSAMIAVAIIAAVVVAFSCQIYSAKIGGKVANTSGEMAKILFFRLFAPLAIIVCAAFCIYEDAYEDPTIFLLLMLSALVPVIMKPLLAARTQEGADAASDALGFQMYLNTAERNELEMFNPPEDTPEVFEKLLPYAFALDAANTWANRFSDTLRAYRFVPDWYIGNDFYRFTAYNGMSGFASSLSKAVSVSMTPPHSSGGSGSGGRGFSGGGGGGGGGHGW